MTLFESPVLNHILRIAPETIILITFLILLLQKTSGRKGATLAIIGCILFLLVLLGGIARTVILAQADFEIAIFDSLLYKVTHYGLMLLTLASYGLWVLAFYSLSKDQDQLVMLGQEDSYPPPSPGISAPPAGLNEVYPPQPS